MEADLPPLSEEELQTPAPEEVTDAQVLEDRIEKILHEVYMEYNARLYIRHTSKKRFYDDNREMARQVALEEIMTERLRKARLLVGGRVVLSLTNYMSELQCTFDYCTMTSYAYCTMTSYAYCTMTSYAYCTMTSYAYCR